MSEPRLRDCTLALLCGPGDSPAPALQQLERWRALTDEVLICCAEASAHLGLGLPLVSDRLAGAGVLGGLHAALTVARGATVLALAAARPPPEEALLRWLADFPGQASAVVLERAGVLYPLPGRYRRSALRPLARALGEGRHEMSRLLREIHAAGLSSTEGQRIEGQSIEGQCCGPPRSGLSSDP